MGYKRVIILILIITNCHLVIIILITIIIVIIIIIIDIIIMSNITKEGLVIRGGCARTRWQEGEIRHEKGTTGAGTKRRTILD